jgi:hypothetical protein
MTKIDDISEGDIVVIRTGASGMLLEEASERILGRDENERLSILATDWKSALEALLVTHDSREVAAALLERGLSVKAASIQQWVGPDVLGPRSENILRELIYLLAEKGKIQKSGETLTSYAESSWQALQDLRGLHQKAGSLIRDDLFKALSSRFGTRCFSDTLPDRDSIRIDASDAQLLLLRVAALDMNVSYVPHSRIYRLDDLVNNKWLR